MGKTETIKERAIYIYLPSVELAKEWKNRAEKQSTSISKFIINTVEDSLKKEEDPSYKSRSDLWKELEKLRQENIDLRKNNKLLERVAEKLEEENRKHRAKPFVEDDFEGIRKFQKELVDILKLGGVFRSEEILDRLSIDASEHEAVKSISKQLEILQDYGLVKATPRGWMWVK